ncbi:DNA ligase [Alicyclobacillus fodiniaquatilis]|uniref:DNA ligase (ATP) n=1 Tax=Alicyclobacillus fodiniaquatilis TaxID=1661150 RepID=A0ABW4JM13_9BACL
MEPIVPFEPVRHETIPLTGEWIAQIKWDGVRLLTYDDGRGVWLGNRRGRDRTKHYPELVEVQRYCRCQSVILDGEVIALGPDGKPSFHEVMRRDGIRRMERVEGMLSVAPITYMVFDVLYLNGVWLTKRPFTERQNMLADILLPDQSVQLVTNHNDATALFEVVKEFGMEGIVMKRPESPYLVAGKNDNWVKVKNYKDVVAVIGGYTLADSGKVNALLLGLYNGEGELWYIGHSGTGKLTEKEWGALTGILQLQEIDERPFANTPDRRKNAYWIVPKYTVKVQFAEWTSHGTLRQASIQAFVDMDPHKCVFESV